MSLLEILFADGFVLKRKASTNGGEYAGPCPFCGGDDRFIVWPVKGRYWCRSCGKTGDTIQYLRDFRWLSFFNACAVSGCEPTRNLRVTRTAEAVWRPKESTTAPNAWQVKAQSFHDRTADLLWSPESESMRCWLHDEKGLQDETIRKAGLGFNPTTIHEQRSSWGIDVAFKEDGSEQQQWLPAGIVIPWIDNGQVSRLRIRRMKPGDDPRYAIVSGSSMVPMILGPEMKSIVVVESELDALLISQEAGDLCSVIAMGFAQARPDRNTHEILSKCETILIALDSDDAGAKAAWKFWPETYGSKVRRWPCVLGKDPSEAWHNGLDIEAWIATGISSTALISNI
jgi:DNA primase